MNERIQKVLEEKGIGWLYTTEVLDRWNNYLQEREMAGLKDRRVSLGEATRLFSDGPEGFEFLPILSILIDGYNRDHELRSNNQPIFVSRGNLLEDLDQLS